MVYAKIIIDVDNDAFASGNRGVEVARILRDLADAAENGNSSFNQKLRDINGNRVGYAEYLLW